VEGTGEEDIQEVQGGTGGVGTLRARVAEVAIHQARAVTEEVRLDTEEVLQEEGARREEAGPHREGVDHTQMRTKSEVLARGRTVEEGRSPEIENLASQRKNETKPLRESQAGHKPVGYLVERLQT